MCVVANLVSVTGASGFVGRAVVKALALEQGIEVTAVVRRNDVKFESAVQAINIGDLAPDTDWSAALIGVSTVVHAAARVHVMHDTTADPLAAFRAVNVDGTLSLARRQSHRG